jgi:hypothetical protein
VSRATGQLRFDVYGRYQVHVERREGGWRVMRVGADGKRALMHLLIPADVPESRLAEALDDLVHEEAVPGATIRRLED